MTLRDRGRATPPENQPFLPILGVLGFGALLKPSTLTGVFGERGELGEMLLPRSQHFRSQLGLHLGQVEPSVKKKGRF